ncbi:hypothetical protein [Streptomyces sp. NPDC017556]
MPMEVIGSLEERYDVRIPKAEAKTFKSVQEAVDFVVLYTA